MTVIVPVRNEETAIAQTLDHLLDQQQGDLRVEILVVDGRSTDGTRKIVRSYAEKHDVIHLLDNPASISSSARNIGIQHSHSDYILIVDGHCEIPSQTYFLDLIEAFEQSGADCLGRPQPLDVSQATNLQRAIAAARSSRLGHHPGSLIYTDTETDCPAASVAVAYRRSVFEEVGDFDERFDACEDYELNHRIDNALLKCRFIPKLIVKYRPRNSLRSLFRQLYRYGRGRVRLVRKHPHSSDFISKLTPFLLALFAGPLVCWAFPFLWTPYLATIGVYLAIVSATSLGESIRKRDAKLLLWMPAAFLTIHIGAGTGILMETFAGWGRKL